MIIQLPATFPSDPRVIGLSDLAFRTHIEALCYCTTYGTGGWLDAGLLVSRREVIPELVAAGLWEENGHGYLIEGIPWPRRLRVVTTEER